MNSLKQEFSDPHLITDELITKSLMNKKLRDELIQMRNLNISETNSQINDDIVSFKALYFWPLAVIPQHFKLLITISFGNPDQISLINIINLQHL